MTETKTSHTPHSKPRSKWRDVWDQFRKHKGALIGSIVFFTIVISVMIGPLVWPFEANEINIRARNQGPSWLHPFGTDQLGRDTFSRMIAGGQTSISVGLAAMTLSLLLGSFIGVMAGYYRRAFNALYRFISVFTVASITVGYDVAVSRTS